MAESKKSNFSVTCSRLSQYLKKNRSFADLPVLDIAPKTQEPNKGSYRPPTTLNLLPGLEASAETETEIDDAVSVSDRNFTETKEPENALLTIFYGGKVMVFDDFSPERAADLMNLAASTLAAPAGAHNVVNPVNLNTTDVPMQVRRASLYRFLEKRKDRINSKAPYQINASAKVGPTTKPQLEARSWLGLGQEISN